MKIGKECYNGAVYGKVIIPGFKMIDLNKLEQYRENNRIEAKRAQGGLPRSIWETYSAFANTLGGLILLGVEEAADKSLFAAGLPDPEALAEELMEKAADPEVVSVNLLNKNNVRLEEADEKKILVVDVPQAPLHLSPVYIEGDPVSGAFIRCGEGDYRLTPEERDAMFHREEKRRDAMKKQMIIEYLTDHSEGRLEEIARFIKSGRQPAKTYLDDLKKEGLITETECFTEGGMPKYKYRLPF